MQYGSIHGVSKQIWFGDIFNHWQLGMKDGTMHNMGNEVQLRMEPFQKMEDDIVPRLAHIWEDISSQAFI